MVYLCTPCRGGAATPKMLPLPTAAGITGAAMIDAGCMEVATAADADTEVGLAVTWVGVTTGESGEEFASARRCSLGVLNSDAEPRLCDNACDPDCDGASEGEDTLDKSQSIPFISSSAFWNHCCASGATVTPKSPGEPRLCTFAAWFCDNCLARLAKNGKDCSTFARACLHELRSKPASILAEDRASSSTSCDASAMALWAFSYLVELRSVSSDCAAVSLSVLSISTSAPSSPMLRASGTPRWAGPL
mmetsp:Transcript_7891/g.17409  ORF Transcript_7891/g.17409 Transcript_7891/m.17409 type:complete len:248 (+) Transcript_7891:387-1130(+)